MQRGKFITIEGQDGAGKSTNVDAMKAFLEFQEITFVQTREPGGTPFGEKIRELLLNSKDDSIGDKAELLLVFAARAQHILNVIEPALSKGRWVLCDRFTDATYAYQGAGRGIDSQDISELEQNVQGALRPDLTIVLDLPVELSESRAGRRSAPDRFEQQKIDFKRKVRNCYLTRAEAESDRMKVIDASQSVEGVRADVVACLAEFCSRNG